ncbi:MAG: ester cyclase [Caldilineaceae bacterium]|nr:ester cyclase [Caldilineaceae bacterium]
MTTQGIVAFIQRGYDAYNVHQSDPHWLDYATEDVAEDGEVVDIPSGMVLRGPDGLRQSLLGFSTAFPDSSVEVTGIFATEEHAVVEFIVRGTHTGVLHTPAGDIPPTGRKFELHLCDAYQLRNRKIIRHATYYDALGLMQQLGVMQ